MQVIGSSFFLLAVLTFIMLSYYSGGFGSMPAVHAAYFGPKNVYLMY